MQTPPQWLLDEIQQLDEQKRRLQVEAEALGSQRLLQQRAVEALRVCGGEPAQAFDRMTSDQQIRGLASPGYGCALRFERRTRTTPQGVGFNLETAWREY